MLRKNWVSPALPYGHISIRIKTPCRFDSPVLYLKMTRTPGKGSARENHKPPFHRIHNQSYHSKVNPKAPDAAAIRRTISPLSGRLPTSGYHGKSLQSECPGRCVRSSVSPSRKQLFKYGQHFLNTVCISLSVSIPNSIGSYS